MTDCYKKVDLELNEIKKKSMGAAEESAKNGCEGSVEFGQ